MGLPVIASRLDGIARYFTDADVAFFRPADPDDLALKLRGVLLEPTAARERAARAARRLLTIAWNEQRARYLALIDEMANASSPVGGQER
jgi:glycosyltransferase involved in cell wall biosynthesis